LLFEDNKSPAEIHSFLEGIILIQDIQIFIRITEKSY